MSDMPNPGSFQNIGLLISAQQVKCETMWFKLSKNSRSSIESDASLQSYWSVKFMKNAYASLSQHFS